ncbi:hypothetical protein [Paenibacillus tarimensis]|uniref:hypothetical protein n=1 Tax=Paenibacillus tarimensis TaxID=416012 RepID=UPI001F2A6DAC|nr:hypothetical protein [Paenibacillus tarimensis]MCF2943348.1 hypothetical protein [Paenibacillus tarimensis]
MRREAVILLESLVIALSVVISMYVYYFIQAHGLQENIWEDGPPPVLVESTVEKLESHDGTVRVHYFLPYDLFDYAKASTAASLLYGSIRYAVWRLRVKRTGHG